MDRPTMPDASELLPFEVLHSRDEDPNERSPLCYRERTYVVPADTSDAVVEAILMARFEELYEELAVRPKGKLANLAIFDHAWTGRPERPPLITLQWKDWRGEPIVHRPSVASAPVTAAPVAAAPVAAAPVAAAPVSVAPVAAAPVSAPPVSVAPVSAPPVAAAEPIAPPFATTPALDTADDLDLAFTEPVTAPSQTPAQTPPRQSAPPPSDRLAAAFEALTDLFFLTTPVDGLEFVNRLLNDLVPSEAISACLYDINADELRFVALTGPGADERRGEGVPRLSGLMGAAATHPGEPLLIESAAREAGFDPGVDGRLGLSVENLALMAVTHQGRLLGMLQLINRRDQAQYSGADANLLAYVAEKLGEFLQSARMRSGEHRA